MPIGSVKQILTAVKQYIIFTHTTTVKKYYGIRVNNMHGDHHHPPITTYQLKKKQPPKAYLAAYILTKGRKGPPYANRVSSRDRVPDKARLYQI